MANVVAYPDIALEKFTGLDPSEDAQDFINLIIRKIQFSLGTRPAADPDQAAVYDARQRALFGSVLRGPAAQWFESLNPALAWNDIRTQFIARFTDEKDKYRKRIEVENLRRQPEELIKSYIHRLTKTIEKGWPDPDFNEAFREGKSMEYFVRRLTPPALKQKVHQFLIENVGATWQQLRDHVSTKDLSFAVSSEFTGTSSNSMDNKLEIEGLKNQIRELTSLMKDHKINATYNNNNPRMNQNQTRFCKYCRKSGHTIAYCYKRKENKEQNKQPPQTRDKFTDNYRQNRGRSPGQQSHYPNNNDRRRDNYPSENNRQHTPNYRNNSPHSSNYTSSNRHRSGSYDSRYRQNQRDSYRSDRNSSRDRPNSEQRYRNYSNERSNDSNRQGNRPNSGYNSRDNSRERSPKVHFMNNSSSSYFSDDENNHANLN